MERGPERLSCPSRAALHGAGYFYLEREMPEVIRIWKELVEPHKPVGLFYHPAKTSQPTRNCDRNKFGKNLKWVRSQLTGIR